MLKQALSPKLYDRFTRLPADQKCWGASVLITLIYSSRYLPDSVLASIVVFVSRITVATIVGAIVGILILAITGLQYSDNIGERIRPTCLYCISIIQVFALVLNLPNAAPDWLVAKFGF